MMYGIIIGGLTLEVMVRRNNMKFEITSTESLIEDACLKVEKLYLKLLMKMIAFKK